MSSILVGIFKATVGLLIDKARAKTAEKLKDGDVLDQNFRSLIVKNIDEIKTKLDGLSRKDLLASLEIFKTGILSLNQVLEKTSSGEEAATASGELGNSRQEETATDPSEQAAALSVAKQIQVLQLNDLNESAKQSLSDAKQRFQEARLEAIRAFGNEALSTSDRILALKIRLMATILERVDRPADALDECVLCLENLHAMPAVRENLRVCLTGGVKSLLNKKDREAIVLAVCQANHIVFRVVQIISAEGNLPCVVDLGSESVDILRDGRMVKLLQKHDMGHLYHGFWSFGLEGEVVNCITVNSRGQFIVAVEKSGVRVYSSRGMFLYSLFPEDTQRRERPFVFGVATDPLLDDVCVLFEWRLLRDGSRSLHSDLVSRELEVFDQHGKRLQTFNSVTQGFVSTAVAVNFNSQIFVLGHSQGLKGRRDDGNYWVEVIDYGFTESVPSFGQGTLKSPRAICVAGDFSILVLDLGGSPCVHSFCRSGFHKHQFALQGDLKGDLDGSMAFNRNNDTVITSVWSEENAKTGGVSVHSKDGKFVKDIRAFAGKTAFEAHEIAVTLDGRIAVVTGRGNKICVVEVKDYDFM